MNKKILKKAIIRGFILFFTLLLLEVLFQMYKYYEMQEKKQILANISADLAQDIQSSIMQEVAVLNTAEQMLRITNFDEKIIMDWLPQLFHNNAGYTAVQIAPKGVVSYIHPLAGNEKAVGHNLLADPKRKAGAMKAIQEKKITFIGPITLIQNGKKAIIIRKPVFYLDKFWGFTIILLEIEDIINNSFSLFERDIAFSLVGYNPDAKTPPIIYQSERYHNRFAVENKVKLPSATWVLKSTFVEKKYQEYKNRIILYLFGLAISMIIIHFQIRYEMQKSKNIELEQKNAVLATAVTANHTINQPLTIIKLRLEVIKSQLGEENSDESNAEIMQSFSKIDDEISKISGILRKLASIEEIHFEDYSENTKMVCLEQSKK